MIERVCYPQPHAPAPGCEQARHQTAEQIVADHNAKEARAMREWRVIEDIPGEFEIVDADGETIVMYVSQEHAAQIAAEHNTRAALEAQVERYREALDSAADALTGTAWYAKSVGHMGLHQNVQDVLKGIETALATAGPAGGVVGEE